ncbi:MAG: type III secretion system chaperone [Pseudomonadota bacterium]
MAAFEDFVSAFASRLGVTLDVVENNAGVLLNNRLQMSMTYDPDGDLLEISTPMTLVHDGVPAGLLAPLLEKNLPNTDTAGAAIRRRPGRDHLELINVVPMTCLGADDLASLAQRQALSAIALEDQVDQAIEKYLDEH